MGWLVTGVISPTLIPQRPKWICEATPDYLYQQSALEHIADLPGDVTILFMLRHPADRAYSLFNFAQNNISVVPKKIDFGTLLDDIERNAESYADRPILRNHYSSWLLLQLFAQMESALRRADQNSSV
jgi:hypothetical protein